VTVLRLIPDLVVLDLGFGVGLGAGLPVPAVDGAVRHV
jgi:hypothetical protein